KLTREHLRYGRFEGNVSIALIGSCRQLAEHGIRGVSLAGKPCELALRDFKRRYRFPELNSPLRVGGHVVQDLPGRAGTSGGERQATAVEHMYRDRETFPNLPEDVVGRDGEILIRQLRLG